MSNKQKPFSEYSSFQDLLGAKDLQTITLELHRLIHKNRWIAENKTADIFYESGSQRGVLVEISDDLAARLQQEDNTSILNLDSRRSCRVISRYLSEAPIDKAKSIAISLIKSGLMKDILHQLNITRVEIQEKIISFYNMANKKVEDAFNVFYMYGWIDEANIDREHLLESNNQSNIVNYFKNREVNGLKPDVKEINAFRKELNKLRETAWRWLNPTYNDLFKHFDITGDKYRYCYAKAQKEVSKLLNN